MKASLILDDTNQAGKPYYHNVISVDTETGEGQSSIKFQGQTYKRAFSLVDNSLWEEVLDAFLFKKDNILGKLITWNKDDTAVGSVE